MERIFLAMEYFSQLLTIQIHIFSNVNQIRIFAQLFNFYREHLGYLMNLSCAKVKKLEKQSHEKDEIIKELREILKNLDIDEKLSRDQLLQSYYVVKADSPKLEEESKEKKGEKLDIETKYQFSTHEVNRESETIITQEEEEEYYDIILDSQDEHFVKEEDQELQVKKKEEETEEKVEKIENLLENEDKPSVISGNKLSIIKESELDKNTDQIENIVDINEADVELNIE